LGIVANLNDDKVVCAEQVKGKGKQNIAVWNKPSSLHELTCIWDHTMLSSTGRSDIPSFTPAS